MNGSDKKRSSLNLSLDYRLICGLLLLIIAAMVMLWRPWEPQIDKNSRTIDVTGEAKITEEPDQYNFYPRYEFTGMDRSAALSRMGQKSDEIVNQLKKLGVVESKIKTNSGGYERGYYPPSVMDGGETSYSLGIEVIVNDRQLADKVLDYLVTTEPSGSVSPDAQFSDDKRKQLEEKARDEATKDARKKAEQTAKNLGYKVGKVKSVSDNSFWPIMPFERGATSDADSRQKLSINPGQNDINYQVKVTFFIN